MMRLTVHVRPGARSNQVAGSQAGSLLVRVRARAVEGAANEAVIEAVASAFGLKARQVTLVLGRHGRRKVLELDIDAADGEAQAARLKGHVG
jgi:uncharacterized protein YggU (UPF0235/DUF167 family)